MFFFPSSFEHHNVSLSVFARCVIETKVVFCPLFDKDNQIGMKNGEQEKESELEKKKKTEVKIKTDRVTPF